MTRFAVCFLMVFGELALGGMFALAVPPFFQVERGFYKSTASVYLASGLVTAVGLAMLASRAQRGIAPGPLRLWIACLLWIIFCILLALYLYTLWSDDAAIRARAFSAGLAAGIFAVIANALMLQPSSFGRAAAVACAMTALTSSLVLGLVSGAMMFGHWYLIDLSMPVDYLRSFVRLLIVALVADLAAIVFAILLLFVLGGPGGRAALASLFDAHLMLFAIRIILGPVATLVLAWMCWQTLKIPQTMAATGLLYIALMSVIVGEMLGRFILFRTALPL